MSFYLFWGWYCFTETVLRHSFSVFFEMVYSLYYYKPDSVHEIEFFIERSGAVIPIEVKAGNRSTPSLNQYIARYRPPFAYKLTNTQNGRVDEKITLPHYMVMFIWSIWIPVASSLQHLSDSEQTGAFSVQPSIQLSKNLGSDPGFAISHYLGRYTHRVAISNNRILNVRNGQVTFKWRDYADGRKEKIMTLSAMEFIRRFLLHVLPKGFMKIRHYGLLGNRNKTKKLTPCKRLTKTPIRQKEKLPTLRLIRKLIGHDITTCPVCGTLLLHTSLPPPLVS